MDVGDYSKLFLSDFADYLSGWKILFNNFLGRTNFPTVYEILLQLGGEKKITDNRKRKKKVKKKGEHENNKETQWTKKRQKEKRRRGISEKEKEAQEKRRTREKKCVRVSFISLYFNFSNLLLGVVDFNKQDTRFKYVDIRIAPHLKGVSSWQHFHLHDCTERKEKRTEKRKGE